jgi:adenylate cyclase
VWLVDDDTTASTPSTPSDPDDRHTFLQRRMLKSLAKKARKRPGEPLGEEDWGAYFEMGSQRSSRMMKAVMRTLPATPRCGFCGAPFEGAGGRLVRPFGYRPSRKNPNICAVCVELAPPGGMTADVGVLFADLRGFTSRAEALAPSETSALLLTFYRCAEQVLLPEALIDKLIGDEVMALYVPYFVGQLSKSKQPADGATVATVMVDHARELLERIGYGSKEGPSLQVGIGLDFGEAFIGNIGDSAVRDFTAVGDVVNTASRLQAEAGGGEVIVSERLARHLPEPPGELEQLALKGKQQPVAAYRVSWFADT